MFWYSYKDAIFSILAGTPYEGGAFKMKLVLGKDFPQSPPRGNYAFLLFKFVFFAFLKIAMSCIYLC